MQLTFLNFKNNHFVDHISQSSSEKKKILKLSENRPS